MTGKSGRTVFGLRSIPIGKVRPESTPPPTKARSRPILHGQKHKHPVPPVFPNTTRTNESTERILHPPPHPRTRRIDLRAKKRSPQTIPAQTQMPKQASNRKRHQSVRKIPHRAKLPQPKQILPDRIYPYRPPSSEYSGQASRLTDSYPTGRSATRKRRLTFCWPTFRFSPTERATSGNTGCRSM